MEYAISGKINTNLNKQYLLTRENEYVVLQYIGSQFTNEWLYDIFPHRKFYFIFYSNQLYCSVMRDIGSEVCKNMRTQLSHFLKRQGR